MMDETFKGIFKGKVVIVGIGNTLRQDDGLGPALIKRLNGRIRARCFDVGTSPENYLGKVARERPDTILIIDALHLGKEAGEFEIVKKGEIVKSGLSTHDISPKQLIEYLQNETKADIYMLGVQPKSVSFGEEISSNVKKTLDQIAEMIIEQCRLTHSS